MRWLVALALLAGCDRLLGIQHLPVDGSATGSGDAAGSIDDGDLPPAHDCTKFTDLAQVKFTANIEPIIDFSVDATGSHALVWGTRTGIVDNTVHPLVPTGDPDTWDLDFSRDTFDTSAFYPRIFADGDSAFATGPAPQASGYGLYNYYFNQAWSRGLAIDTAASPETPRATSVTQLPDDIILIEQLPVAKTLQYRTASSGWTPQPYLDAINQQQPAGASLSPDGRVLVYSTTNGGSISKLFVTHRATLTDPFTEGVPVMLTDPAPQLDDLEPQIFGACERLYFRAGSGFYVAY